MAARRAEETGKAAAAKIVADRNEVRERDQQALQAAYIPGESMDMLAYRNVQRRDRDR